MLKVWSETLLSRGKAHLNKVLHSLRLRGEPLTYLGGDLPEHKGSAQEDCLVVTVERFLEHQLHLERCAPEVIKVSRGGESGADLHHRRHRDVCQLVL